MVFNKTLEKKFDSTRKPTEVLDSTKFVLDTLGGKVSEEVMAQIIKTVKKTFELCGPQEAKKEVLALAEGLDRLEREKGNLSSKERRSATNKNYTYGKAN